jgi:hypothetical protein
MNKQEYKISKGVGAWTTVLSQMVAWLFEGKRCQKGDLSKYFFLDL